MTRSMLGILAAGAVATLVAGYVLLPKAPIAALPEFSPPYVEVQTEALGLSAEEVEELVPAHPRPSPHDLVLHHRDVRGGAAEGRGPELEEEPRQFEERVPLGVQTPPLLGSRGTRHGPTVNW